MIIKKMSASFGTLGGRTLELHDGLNIVEAPNESGKSTWCAFMKAMLYGIDTAERNSKGILADKNKYLPFSGQNMEGSMLVEQDGRDIMLERTGPARAPMCKLSAYYCDSSTPVDASSVDIGEMLTGVSRGVFERSAFISGRTMRISNIPELEKKISSVAATGDEEFSVSEADKRLKTWYRRRNYRQTGEIQVLDERLRKVNTQFSESSELGQKAGEIRVSLEACLRDITTYKNELEAHRLMAIVRQAERARKALEATELAEKNFAEALVKCEELGQPTEESVRDQRARLASLRTLSETRKQSCESAEKRVSELTASVKELSEKHSAKAPSKAVIIIDIIAMILAAAAGFLRNMPLLYIPAAALLIAAVVLLIVSSKAHRSELNDISQRKIAEERLKDASDELSEAKSRLAETENELSGLREEDIDEAERAIAALNTAKTRLDTAKEVSDNTEMPENVVEPELVPVHSEEEARSLLAEAERKASQLKSAYDMALGRQQSYPDPVSLRTESIELQSRIDGLTDQCRAIELASKVILEAGEEMRARFSPSLSQLTGKYLSRMTGGRYAVAAVDAALDACVTAEGDVVSHSAAYLSAGALDQLYLALRLAISSMVLSEDCPLILDDAFISFDDERLKNALGLLSEIAEKRQVIIFTCQSREAIAASEI